MGFFASSGKVRARRPSYGLVVLDDKLQVVASQFLVLRGDERQHYGSIYREVCHCAYVGFKGPPVSLILQDGGHAHQDPLKLAADAIATAAASEVFVPNVYWITTTQLREAVGLKRAHIRHAYEREKYYRARVSELLTPDSPEDGDWPPALAHAGLLAYYGIKKGLPQ